MTLCELLIDLGLLRKRKDDVYERLGPWDDKQLEVLGEKKFWVCQGNIRGIKPTLTDIKVVFKPEIHPNEYVIESAMAFHGNKYYITFYTSSIGSAHVFYTEEECVSYYLKEADECVKSLLKKREELDNKIKKIYDEIDKYAFLI